MEWRRVDREIWESNIGCFLTLVSVTREPRMWSKCLSSCVYFGDLKGSWIVPNFARSADSGACDCWLRGLHLKPAHTASCAVALWDPIAVPLVRPQQPHQAREHTLGVRPAVNFVLPQACSVILRILWNLSEHQLLYLLYQMPNNSTYFRRSLTS